ncbi:MAG TPA: D-alanyl-D-alanine carboxypeptidase/D-alanyl-D-alanine-endopeptidase, partial [Burkholderiaceae bacterium]|nr:D-alanyl-D-alanine carboxypeptidase/D-alanyl-D-alanine-endopeptidase [Burkholderiaceae bacterium]
VVSAAIALLMFLSLTSANAQPVQSGVVLPESVSAALKVANVPLSAVGVTVVPVSGAGMTLAANENQLLNPASTMKLVTTLAGLELLGPQYQWRTDVLTAAPLRNGVLEGDLWLRGSGDPQLVIEDLWLLVQRLRGVGVREIRGSLMLDRSAFEPAPHDPRAFDGEALRPYNAGPDALLLNYKTVFFHFVADPENKQARVYALPALAGMSVPATVRGSDGACNDWRARLGGDFSDPLRPLFRGSYPLACGDKVWHISVLDHALYAEAIFRALWESSGGVWRGRVREGSVPPDSKRLAQHESKPLAEVIRDINKYSNNVMARQLFLTLGTETTRRPANTERAQRAVGDWLVSKGLDRREFVLENGAGLSRVERLTTAGLARLLQAAFASPMMPEFVSSLPIVGLDGTMRRRSGAVGSAHIKTGLLADTRAIAGYVLSASGRRYAVVAFINHPNAGAGQPALDALLNWVYVQG